MRQCGTLQRVRTAAAGGSIWDKSGPPSPSHCFPIPCSPSANRSMSCRVEYTYADARMASAAPKRLSSGIAAMSPALTAIPRSSNAPATFIGVCPSMTKVNTGTRLSALRGPMSRSRGIPANRSRPCLTSAWSCRDQASSPASAKKRMAAARPTALRRREFPPGTSARRARIQRGRARHREPYCCRHGTAASNPAARDVPRRRRSPLARASCAPRRRQSHIPDDSRRRFSGSWAPTPSPHCPGTSAGAHGRIGEVQGTQTATLCSRRSVVRWLGCHLSREPAWRGIDQRTADEPPTTGIHVIPPETVPAFGDA